MPPKSRESISDAFLERYENLRENIKLSLRKFIANPSERNIHDLRSAFRRLNASFSVLPKRLLDEGDSIRKYVAKNKQVLKQTSSVRDTDIIRERLEQGVINIHGKSLISSLKKVREDQLKKPIRNARKLSKKMVPALNSMNAENLEDSIDRAVTRLTSEITNYLVTALEGPDNTEDLHSLRKTVRELRYALEMLPDNERTRREIGILIKWQDALGDILDSNVFESYLRSLQVTAFNEIWAQQERIERDRKYQEFVKIYKRSKSPILREFSHSLDKPKL